MENVARHSDYKNTANKSRCLACNKKETYWDYSGKNKCKNKMLFKHYQIFLDFLESSFKFIQNVLWLTWQSILELGLNPQQVNGLNFLRIRKIYLVAIKVKLYCCILYLFHNLVHSDLYWRSYIDKSTQQPHKLLHENTGS